MTIDVDDGTVLTMERPARSVVQLEVPTPAVATFERPGHTVLGINVVDAHEVVVPPDDADYTAFITAAAITDPTQQAALEQLVADLKAGGLWAKLHALWPMVGGTAAAHKWNLLDPRDLDAAYPLTFHGGLVHSANGIQPDGGTGWADTHLVPTVALTATSGSIGFYSRTDANSGQPYDMGASTGTDTAALICIAEYGSENMFACYGTSAYTTAVGNTDGRGFYSTNRNGGTNTEGYRNGARVINGPDAVVLPAFSLTLFANNHGGTPTYFSNKQQACAFVGDGLTVLEQASLYTAVQTFQTALGRAV